MSVKKRVYAVVIIEGIFMGLTFLGAKIALRELDALQVLAARWTIAMILFILLAALKVIKIQLKGKPVWMLGVLAFVLPCVSAICETCGIDLTTTSESAIMFAMIPAMVVLLSVIVLRQTVAKTAAAGVALSLAGVIIAIAFSEGFSMGGKALGYLLLIGMAVTGAVHTILSNRMADRFSPMERSFAMAVAGGIWFNGINLVRGTAAEGYLVCFQEVDAGLAVLFLGLAGSFMCYGLFNYVVSHMPATQAATLHVNIITVTGVVTGILLQGDSFGWYTAVGLVMVIAGVIITNREPASLDTSVSS